MQLKNWVPTNNQDDRSLEKQVTWQHLTVRRKVGVITIMGSRLRMAARGLTYRYQRRWLEHGVPRDKINGQSKRVLFIIYNQNRSRMVW